MKLPRPLTDNEYERRLNGLIARLNKHDRHPSNLPEASTIRRVYKAVERLGTATLREICEHEFGFTPTVGESRTRAWTVYSRIKYLMRYGWLELGDPQAKSWQIRHPGHTATHSITTYRVGPGGSGWLAQAQMGRFLEAVARLDQRRIGGQYLAQWLAENGSNFRSLREAEMITRRLQGETLKQIGASYGVTRERVRQIVQRAVADSGPPRVKYIKPERTHFFRRRAFDLITTWLRATF